jgi:hypothetical protein
MNGPGRKPQQGSVAEDRRDSRSQGANDPAQSRALGRSSSMRIVTTSTAAYSISEFNCSNISMPAAGALPTDRRSAFCTRGSGSRWGGRSRTGGVRKEVSSNPLCLSFAPFARPKDTASAISDSGSHRPSRSFKVEARSSRARSLTLPTRSFGTHRNGDRQAITTNAATAQRRRASRRSDYPFGSTERGLSRFGKRARHRLGVRANEAFHAMNARRSGVGSRSTFFGCSRLQPVYRKRGLEATCGASPQLAKRPAGVSNRSGALRLRA